MHNITRIFLLLLLGLVITSCGGGGGKGDPFIGAKAEAPIVAAKLVITTDAEEIKSDGSTVVTVIATATDSNNVALEGVELEISVDSGVLQILQSLTDSSGQATAIISTGNDSTERTITVTVTSGKISTSTTIAVVDELSGADAGQIGLVISSPELSADGSDSVTVTAIVTDDKNVVVDGAKVSFSADSGALAVTQGTTDSAGQALAELTTGGDSTPRTITITASSGAASTTIEVDVVNGLVIPMVGQLVLLASADEMKTDGTDPITLTAIITDNNHVVVEGADVIFTADSGALQITEPATGPTGQAQALLSTGGNPAVRTITVTAVSGSLSDSITVDVVDLPSGPVITTLDLLVSSPQLGSSGKDTVDITAVAKDKDNVVTEGVEVAFAASSGTLQVTQPETDAAGQALAILSTQGETNNRTITVTANAGGLTSTATVNVTGTSVTISGETSLTLGASTVLTIQLKDSDANPIPGILMTVGSSAGNTITPTKGSFVTDSSGELQVSVNADADGTDTITASAEGASGVFTLAVSADQFHFILPTVGSEIDIDGMAQDIVVEWLSGGVAQVGKVVNFTATRGTLSATSSTTDASGRTTLPTINIGSNSAGPSTITAFVTNGPSATLSVEFIATTPASVSLQANKSTIGPNDGSEAAEQKAILTATLRDANNNLVKGKTLRFMITQDTTGGTLTNATAITNSLGQASVSYVSSGATSATDGVVIRVEVEEDPTVAKTVSLTVAQKSLFVKLGTGNSIDEPNGALYELPYSVIVTDSGGNPVEGILVTLKVSPTAYFKGWWLLVGDFWLTFGGPDIASFMNPFPCLSEDQNSDNGILDPGEDINSNGVLDPGNVVAVPTTVTTDENGTALFNLTYGQEFGNWTEVRLTASTEVNGTESIDTEKFTLTVLSDDVNDPEVPPPGVRRGDVLDDLAVPGVFSNLQISPFGWKNDCSDPD